MLVHAQDATGNALLTPISQLKIGDKVLSKSKWKSEEDSLSYEPITGIISTPKSTKMATGTYFPSFIQRAKVAYGEDIIANTSLTTVGRSIAGNTTTNLTPNMDDNAINNCECF